MTQHKVVLTGGILEGFERGHVVSALARLIRKPPEVAERLLSDGAATVKSGLDDATAARYIDALRSIGVQCQLEPDALEFDIGSAASAKPPTSFATDPSGPSPDVGYARAAATSSRAESDDGSGPSLWNPNAAACWSALFSPLFGSYLLSRNWRTLQQPDQIRTERRWFVGFLLVLLAWPFVAHFFEIGSVAKVMGWPLLLVWYFLRARPQVAYVKVELGRDYPRKSWLAPIGIGVVCIAGYLAYALFMTGVLDTVGPKLADLGSKLASPSRRILLECGSHDVTTMVKQVIEDQVNKELPTNSAYRELVNRTRQTFPLELEAIRTTSKDDSARRVNCAAWVLLRFPPGAENKGDMGALLALMALKGNSPLERTAEGFRADLVYSAQPTDDGRLYVEVDGFKPILALFALVLINEEKLQAQSAAAVIAGQSAQVGGAEATRLPLTVVPIQPKPPATSPPEGQHAASSTLRAESHRIVQTGVPTESLRLLLMNGPARDFVADGIDVAEADLDDDGTNEIVIVATSSMWCGSGGCATRVLKRVGNSYRSFDLDSYTYFSQMGQFAVLSTTKNGMRQLAEAGPQGLLLGDKPGTPLFGKPLTRSVVGSR